MSQQMKWIKASERLPEEIGKTYFLRLARNGDETILINFIGLLAWQDKKKKIKRFYETGRAAWNHYLIENVFEWLDEQYSAEPSGEQIHALELAEMEIKAIYKRVGIKGSNVLDIITKTIQAFTLREHGEEGDGRDELLKNIYFYLGGWREAIGLLEDHCSNPVKLKNMIAAIDQIDEVNNKLKQQFHISKK